MVAKIWTLAKLKSCVDGNANANANADAKVSTIALPVLCTGELKMYMPSSQKNYLQGFLTRSDTHRAVQPQKAKGLKFLILKVEATVLAA